MATNRKRMTKAERLAVYEKYGGRCAYCGGKIEFKDMQVDHINPVYRDGDNVMENYNPSCRMCNFYKGTRTLESFREQLSLIYDRLEKIFIFRLAKKYDLASSVDFPAECIRFYFERHRKNE